MSPLAPSPVAQSKANITLPQWEQQRGPPTTGLTDRWPHRHGPDGALGGAARVSHSWFPWAPAPLLLAKTLPAMIAYYHDKPPFQRQCNPGIAPRPDRPLLDCSLEIKKRGHPIGLGEPSPPVTSTSHRPAACPQLSVLQVSDVL